MKNLHFFLFFFITLSLSGQHTSITQEDFNNDGKEDRLKCTYEIGSNFGGTECELVDGKTNKKFTLSNYGCYCAIKKQVSVTPELREKQNEYFLYTLKKEVLPQFKPFPDQSLYWIIKSGLTTQKLTEHPYFDLAFNPANAWRQGEPEPPFTYSIEISAQTLSKIIPDQNEPSNETRSSDHKDYLVYYGDTHISTEQTEAKDFTLIDKNESYQILKTAHGVIAKKGNAYKWLFVTDMHINASPQKLRWASIEEVILHDKFVVIKQSLAPDAEFHLYVVDIEKGIGARLKIDFDILLEKGIEILDLTSEERFALQDNTIVIGNNEHKIKFPLLEIKQELDILIKGN